MPCNKSPDKSHTHIYIHTHHPPPHEQGLKKKKTTPKKKKKKKKSKSSYPCSIALNHRQDLKESSIMTALKPCRSGGFSISTLQ